MHSLPSMSLNAHSAFHGRCHGDACTPDDHPWQGLAIMFLVKRCLRDHYLYLLYQWRESGRVMGGGVMEEISPQKVILLYDAFHLPFN